MPHQAAGLERSKRRKLLAHQIPTNPAAEPAAVLPQRPPGPYAGASNTDQNYFSHQGNLFDPPRAAPLPTPPLPLIATGRKPYDPSPFGPPNQYERPLTGYQPVGPYVGAGFDQGDFFEQQGALQDPAKIRGPAAPQDAFSLFRPTAGAIQKNTLNPRPPSQPLGPLSQQLLAGGNPISAPSGFTRPALGLMTNEEAAVNYRQFPEAFFPNKTVGGRFGQPVPNVPGQGTYDQDVARAQDIARRNNGREAILADLNNRGTGYRPSPPPPEYNFGLRPSGVMDRYVEGPDGKIRARSLGPTGGVAQAPAPTSPQPDPQARRDYLAGRAASLEERNQQRFAREKLKASNRTDRLEQRKGLTFEQKLDAAAPVARQARLAEEARANAFAANAAEDRRNRIEIANIDSGVTAAPNFTVPPSGQGKIDAQTWQDIARLPADQRGAALRRNGIVDQKTIDAITADMSGPQTGWLNRLFGGGQQPAAAGPPATPPPPAPGLAGPPSPAAAPQTRTGMTLPTRKQIEDLLLWIGRGRRYGGWGG